MRILIVGGTGFLGGATARAAVQAGHAVTVMSRTGQHVTAGAAVLLADREQGLPNLRGQFDTVIDTCAYAPHMVTDLAAAVGPVHYVMVSSISVYDDMSVPKFDETTPALPATDADLTLAASIPLDDRCTAEPYGLAYGRLKRSCEIAAIAAFGDSCALIRLGLIVGAGDYTERFTWWVRRCDAGGSLPVPGPAARHIQLIDVRDAADFMLTLAADITRGIFHLTGEVITIAQMLAGIQAETNATLKPRYFPMSKFTDAGLRHWTDLPLILPDDPAFAQMLNVSIAKARSAGLQLRPFADTVGNVLAWDRQHREQPLKCGMSPEQEALL